MLTVFLWTVLIAAFLFLIIIASPIRAAAKIRYHKPEKAECEVLVSYVHPVIFRYEYSTAGEKGGVRVLGRKWGKKKCEIEEDIEDVKISTKSVRRDDSKAKHVAKADIKDDIETDIKTDIKDDVETNIKADVKADVKADIKTDTKIPKQKKPSIIARIKSRIESIKSHKFYKIVNNKPLRKKLLRWLWRLIAGLFKTVTFEKFRLRAAVGYSDPAALGKFYGYFTAARSALELQNRSIDLTMEPVFTEKCLRIDSDLSLKTSLSTILWYILVSAATFPYLRVRRVMKKSHQK